MSKCWANYIGAVFSAMVLLLATSCQNISAPFLADYPEIDLLIVNGQVLDGLGNEPRNADIAIVGDSIVYIGKSQFSPEDLNARVKQVVDARQKIVAPGFIDLHSHGDPLATPEFENFLAMGVTTISLGQDGDSPEVNPLSNWLDQVARQGIAVNLAMFVGHGTLRTLTAINAETGLETDTMAPMLELLDDTLNYTFGLSTGLEYHPGLYADQAELEALAKIVGHKDRLVMSHMRNEDNDQIQASLGELIAQGKYAKVHVAHIKSVYGKGAEEAESILATLDQARQSGIQISADIYPYNASYAGLSLLFPVWAKTTEQFEIAKRDRRDELEQFLREKIIKRNGPAATLLAMPPYTGKTLAEVSSELDLPYEQVLIQLGPKSGYGAYFIMDDELQSRLLADPTICVSSDGSPTGHHPRGHGTFAKIIEEYVNHRHLFSLSEAVRKMTSASAAILGITDRGSLQTGMKADIIIFDPAEVHATATYPEPLSLALGFDTVIVNGRIARMDTKLTRGLFGQVLKP